MNKRSDLGRISLDGPHRSSGRDWWVKWWPAISLTLGLVMAILSVTMLYLGNKQLSIPWITTFVVGVVATTIGATTLVIMHVDKESDVIEWPKE